MVKSKSLRKKLESPLLSPSFRSKEEEEESAKKQGQKKRKYSKETVEDAEEERRLTALLFGGESHGAPSGTDVGILNKELQVSNDKIISSGGDDLFELDRDGEVNEGVDGKQNSEDDLYNTKEDIQEASEYKPAWVDDDDVESDLMKTNRLRKLRQSRDEEVSNMTRRELEQRLRTRFENTTMTVARTDWAKIDAEGVQETFENDTSVAPVLSTSMYKLPPQILQVLRCPDSNQKDPNQAAVQAVHFHPGSDPDQPLMLTAGLDKTLRFFQIGEKESEKIHGIHFDRLPIYTARFLGDSGKVVVSGRRSFFYIYDAIEGKLDLVPKIMGREERSLEKFTTSPDGRIIAFLGNDGYIILVDAQSKQWMFNLKMNGSVRAITFSPNCHHLYASGSDGDVYKFDVRTRRCVERFSNEDGTITSTLASSAKHFAVGAESGVVNLYSNLEMGNRTPIKSIMNLHTSADFSQFNHDGQILAFSTRREKKGLKLLHVPTGTVFSNWPTSNTPLSYVWSLDFSPKSNFLAIGNDKGKCLLYKLLHYNS